MPHLKSLWPTPPTTPSYLNVFDSIMGQPNHDEWPDYILHVDEETGKALSSKQVKDRIHDLAAVLGAPVVDGGLGLRAEDGEMVGIMSDNSSDFVVLALALLKIAVPFVPISCYATPYELKHGLTVTRATKLFVAPYYVSKLLPFVQESGMAKSKVYTMNGCVDGHQSLEGLIRRANTTGIPRTDARIVRKDSLAFLILSSGTTGLPKAVMISHSNVLIAHMQSLIVTQDVVSVTPPMAPMTPDGLPVIPTLLPMYHAFGLHFYCLRAFIRPTRFVIFRKWNATKLLDAIPRYKTTSLSMVPSMWYQLVNHPKFDETDFSSVSTVLNGAAHLPKDVASRFLKKTPKNKFFGEGYGTSEATITAIVRPYPGTLNGRGKEVPGAIGVLLPGMEARIVRIEGDDSDFDEVGELWLKGGNISSGYYGNPQATEETFVDGWLRTGDYFTVNREQYFFFVDRAKDTLKVSGSQVSPLEIEGVLLAHPQNFVADVTVAGVSGGRTSDERIPRAWIVLSDNGKKAGIPQVIEELERWHQTHLSKFKWLRGGIEVVDEIPKSPTGKSLRRVLQEQFERRTAIRANL